jgi:hypothetical protein
MKTKVYALLFLALTISGIKGYGQQIKKTEVLVLGTAHLSTIQNIDKKHLSRLIDSLSVYKFDAVAVEQMPSELLLDIKSRPAKPWQELYSYYSDRINMGDKYQKKFNLNYEKAISIKDSLLIKNQLSISDRALLVRSYLASYDIWSALLNYQYLDKKVELDTTSINLLEKYNTSSNEINLVGINLAKKLNLKQIHYIDNLQDETILTIDYPEFFDEYIISQEKIGELLSTATIFTEVNQLTNQSVESMDLFPLYKFLNSEKYIKEDYNGQWELWFKTNFKSKTDRSRFSLWEMRNLQITANIMRLVAKYPEKKILVIIGASHKSFIEKHLRQIQGIKILEF